MNRLIYKCIAVVFVFLAEVPVPSMAQDQPKFQLGGYVKDLQTVFIPSPDTLPWFSDNTLENRLRLKYYPKSWLTVNAETRTRFMYGDFVKNIPGYTQSIDKHMGAVNLSWSKGARSSYLFHTEIDRLNIDLNLGKWQIVAGRQRVNWGQNLVWNPNDLVNTYNYFNFEYEERPGTDAINVRYYPTYSSVAEAIYVYHAHSDSLSAAALFRFNRWGYDIQLLGGIVQTDWAVGAGWSGSMGKASFRGEATYLAPRIDHGQGEALIAAISSDYTFGEKNHFVHFGALYNSAGKTANAGGIALFTDQQLNPRSLSRGKVNLFGQFSTQPTPLSTVGLSAILNPIDGSAFVSPTVTLSVSENFDFTAVAVLFAGHKNSEYGGVGKMGYLKFKYSF